MTVPIALAIVAGIIALVELVRSRGQEFIAYAVLLLAVASVWGVKL